MAVSVLIAFWVNDELTFNKYHQNYHQIAQVLQHQTYDGYKHTQESVPMPLHMELETKYGDDFKFLVMSSFFYSNILSFEENKLSKNGGFMGVDAPSLLSLNMVKGGINGLQDPGSILLSSSTASALFGKSDPINKPVKINNSQEVLVTGVYEDIPYNSSFHNLQFIAPWKLYVSSEPWVKDAAENPRWDNNSFQLFAQISDHSDMQRVSEKIMRVKHDNLDKSEQIFDAEIFLHPMKDWHLRSNWEKGVQTGGLDQYVWLFGIIGVFVLVLACINFMNLSTAQSEMRSKEVGVRKSLGSARRILIGQFLCESFLVVVTGFVIALFLVFLALPYFNQLANKQIEFPISSYLFWSGCVGFILITGLLSGSYPALYLSSFHPINVLKGTFKVKGHALNLRKILVVVQFTVSVVLIIGTIVVAKQVTYSKNRPVGYQDTGVIMIEMTSPDYYGKYTILRNELLKRDAILEMAQSSSPLTAVYNENGGFDWKGKNPDFFPQFATIWATHSYGKTIGWKIVDGRDFSTEFATDSLGIIVNEASVKYMGLANPVGKTMTWGGEEYSIIGVVQDMLMESPFKSTKQTVYMINPYDDRVNYMELKLNPNKSTTESLAQIKAVFNQYIPDVPFEYIFTEEEHAKKFRAIERIGHLSGIFTLLAILISCLGLFGLASFTAERRIKEIGIRKVLGASLSSIWRLMSGEFLALILVSSIIAIPIAYHLLHTWLLNYEYRTDLQWWVFVIAIIVAVIITIFTVSYHALVAAMKNPVDSLKSE